MNHCQPVIPDEMVQRFSEALYQARRTGEPVDALYEAMCADHALDIEYTESGICISLFPGITRNTPQSQLTAGCS